MAPRTKTRDITIIEEEGAFNAFFKKFSGESQNYDFEGISALRKLFSNEKARILHAIKTKNPHSIYSLAKILGRDFKSVFDDLKLLERFGFIELVSEMEGKRERLKPILVVDIVNISIKI